MWTETPKGKGKKPVNKDRFISYVTAHLSANGRKMFLRGDSVILGRSQTGARCVADSSAEKRGLEYLHMYMLCESIEVTQLTLTLCEDAFALVRLSKLDHRLDGFHVWHQSSQ